MMKKTVAAFVICLVLAACASDKPRIVQASSDMDQVRLTPGMATQIEVPDRVGRVQSVVTGNPSLVTADHVDNIVNLVPKDGTGETNLIVRAKNEDGDSKIYQYRIIVQAP